MLLLGAFLIFRHVLAAVDVGTNEINSTIELGSEDPRRIVARIINFTMLFLGVVAVGIIIFAGFKWMTSQGNEENISSAKKIMKAGVIGLVIILASWGIAAFIINRLIGATGNSTNNGQEDCVGPNCQLIDCDGPGCLGANCDSNSLTEGCQPGSCNTESLTCSPNSCTCVLVPDNPPGGYGASCDSDPETETCDAENQLCDSDQGLTCDTNTCTCVGSPVITDISPMGGFCDGNPLQPCEDDLDCGNGVCNLTVPNGAPGNIISIHGYNFGGSGINSGYSGSIWARIKQLIGSLWGAEPAAAFTAGNRVVFLGDPTTEADDVEALDPIDVNSNCYSNWNNNEIIAIIPVGAQSGPVKVINGSMPGGGVNYDTTDNDQGPPLEDFVVNNIVRPGLCRISPADGQLGDEITYYGVNLGGAGYFGNYQSKFRGLNSSFTNTNGVAGVPNVSSGKMSTFVTNSVGGHDQNSNYLNFKKNSEPDAGPMIASVSPLLGASGQYVTISGSGFGFRRGTSQVFFSNGNNDVEADYNFPPACAQSVWGDNQAIVKVPSGIANGNYKIKMKLGDVEVVNQNITFVASSSAPLLPSACKIEPSRGPANSPVSVWGEYFGAGLATVRFHNNQDVSGNINPDNGAQKVNVLVPATSISGPVRVVKNNQAGNSLNFTVGRCSANTDCSGGTPVCCPLGSPNYGSCVNSLFDNVSGCYSNIPRSVFEWKFNTSAYVSCDDDPLTPTCERNNSRCGVGTSCDPNSCLCIPCPGGNCANNDSCASQGETFCPTGSCPNVPGQCDGSEGQNQNTGIKCDDNSAVNYPYCSTPGMCHYDAISNRYIRYFNPTCNVPVTVSLDVPGQGVRDIVKTCRNSFYEITVPGSCPSGWTNLGNSRCTKYEACSLCPAGGQCVAPAGSATGVCATTIICPQGSSCQNGDCIATADVCECCCEVSQSARDCCFPLTCSGTCGSGNSNFGKCSGCADVGVPGDIAAHDQACNCSGHTGQYCQDDGQGGYCTDCSALTQSGCFDHQDVCCWDGKNDKCRGGAGDLTGTPGACAYYGCNDCSLAEPYNLGNGLIYPSQAQCNSTCGNNSPCSSLLDQNSCSGNASCCWDDPSDACVDGDRISGTDGRCDYYNCKPTPNQDECNSSVATSSGAFTKVSTCNSICSAPQFGLSCAGNNLNSCNTSVCGSVFSCINGNGGQNNSDCGSCCCDPSMTGTDPQDGATYDFCRSINSKLQCLPNKTPCSGNNRGLCCGCSDSSECGSPSVTGCGDDTCCHARPEVVTASTTPTQDQNYVCRNAIITAPFNTKMDIISFPGNFMLLEQHDLGDTCPSGTIQLSMGDANRLDQSLLARAWRTVKNWFVDSTRYLAGLFSQNTWAAPPASDKIYCQVQGSVLPEQLGTQTILKFLPNRLLSPDTVHYAIVLGQENLASSSSGVLSTYNIGMSGGGYNNSGTIYGPFEGAQFPNSYIWSFKTLSDNNATSGICEVDQISIDPPAHVFQKNVNDLNENDIDAGNNTFDTIDDRDRVYTAKAWSTTDQLLQPVTGYSWSWVFSIDHPAYVDFSAVNGLPSDQKLLVVQPNISDKQTTLHSDIHFDQSNYISTADKSASTTVRVFVCSNPWPPVSNSDYWFPEADGVNCNPGSGSCNNFHYEFYYCRDAGDPNTTDDDLPAISSGTGTVSLGQSNRMICSNNNELECSTNPNNPLYGICGNGLCIWEILKESYYFQQSNQSRLIASKLIYLYGKTKES